MFWGLVLLINALVLSSLAGYMSVMGMAALFPAGGLTIICMMTALEVGKLVAAGWLHANWHKKLGGLLKAYLMSALVVLMVMTAIGTFGNLSKSHLEGEAPVAGVEIKIAQIQQRISQTQADRTRLDDRQKQLDAQINTLLSNSKTAKDSAAAQKLQTVQKKERDQLRKDIADKDAQVNTLSDSLAPLKLQISDVDAKLGPLKYVANLFGMKDPTTAVEMIIVMIMITFDPLAVAMLLASQFSFKDFFTRRREAKAAKAIALADTKSILTPITRAELEAPAGELLALPKAIEEPVLVCDTPAHADAPTIDQDIAAIVGYLAPNTPVVLGETVQVEPEKDDLSPTELAPVEQPVIDEPPAQKQDMPEKPRFHEETLVLTEVSPELAAWGENKAKLYDQPPVQAETVAASIHRMVPIPGVTMDDTLHVTPLVVAPIVATPVIPMSSLTGSVLPHDTVVTIQTEPYASYGQTLPFLAQVDTQPVSLHDDPTFMGGYAPKSDREKLLELLERRPDILAQVVSIVEEDIVQQAPSMFPAPKPPIPEKQPETGVNHWMSKPWFP